MRDNDNTIYKLTPEECAAKSLLYAELIDDTEDERVIKFWRQFQSLMLISGHAVIEEE